MHPSARGAYQPSAALVEKADNESDLVYGLRQRVKELEALLGQEWLPPSVLRLTKTERRVLGAIVTHPGLSSHNFIYTVIYGDRIDPPGNDLVRVFISHLRTKLTPHGVFVKNKHGEGYSITPENLARLNALYAPGERA